MYEKSPYLILDPSLLLQALIAKATWFRVVYLALRRNHRIRLDGGNFATAHDGGLMRM